MFYKKKNRKKLDRQETSIEKIFMKLAALVRLREGGERWEKRKNVMNSQIIYVSKCFPEGKRK